MNWISGSSNLARDAPRKCAPKLVIDLIARQMITTRQGNKYAANDRRIAIQRAPCALATVTRPPGR